jgi:hypothetical protein
LEKSRFTPDFAGKEYLLERQPRFEVCKGIVEILIKKIIALFPLL